MRKTVIVISLAVLGGGVGYGATRLPLKGPEISPEATPEITLARETGPSSEFDALHEGLQVSDFVRSEVLAQGGAPIPVLVPFEMTRDRATARRFGFELRITQDGYSALLGDGVLDYVINGTGTSYSRSDDPEDDQAQDDDYMMAYEDFDDGRGGSLSFGFRGADYQVELYCLAESPDPRTNCLDAATLEDFARNLMGG